MINLRTRRQKVQHARQTVRLLDRLEVAAQRRIKPAIVALAMAHAGKGSVVAAEQTLKRAIETTGEVAVRAFYERYRSTKKEAQIFTETKADTEDEFLDRQFEFIVERSAAKVTAISERTRLRVKSILADAVDEALGPAEIARTLRDEIEVFSQSRAMTIARTETHAYAMSSELAAVQDDAEAEDFTMEKEWVSTNDDRTRPDHVDANGQTVALDDDFTVGGANLAHPGDPDGDPGQVINCRCVMVYSVK
ncbi:minor capsid component [Caudoviricetes sp.]|nr:minor capsid component [Caudoviricetes sp.]